MVSGAVLAADILQLQSGESVIIQTFDHPVETQAWKYIQEQPVSLSLDHDWTLRFVQSTPAIEGTFAIDSPTSWTEINHPNAKINMGTGLYLSLIHIFSSFHTHKGNPPDCTPLQ